MLSVLLAIIIGFILGVIIFRGSIGGGIFLALVLSIVVADFSCTMIEKGDEKYAVRDTVEIQSAITGSRIEGSFTLGSGTIKGKRYYAYWTPEGTHRKGAIERRMVSEEKWDIEVIQNDSIDSKIIFTEYKKDETIWQTWIDSRYQRAEIFVPKGSVRYNYKLKAK